MSRLRDVLFTVVLFGATVLVLGFLVLPIVAIFARVPLHLLIDQLDDPIVRDALVLTAVTNAIALAVIIGFGTPAAYLLGRRRFRGRTFVVTLVEIPLVLPPTVAGIGLLAAFALWQLIRGIWRAFGFERRYASPTDLSEAAE